MTEAHGERAAGVISRLRERGLVVATAESCTGGLIAGALTSVAGSSWAVDCGFVTYSNEAKAALLGVPEELIGRVGAVSEEVARAMAEGALARSRADLAISVTGIAGPDGGTPQKPVGLVHFALARKAGETTHDSQLFAGLDREGVRAATVDHALEMLLAAA